MCRISEMEHKLQEQVNVLMSQMSGFQTENRELLDEIKTKDKEIDSYRYIF